MKTIAKMRLVAVLGFLTIASPVFANTTEPTNPVTTTVPATPPSPEAKAEAERLINRLEEIKAMDKSNMTRAEKKALRKEVKEIRATLRSTGNGVYLSVGAIIIIILLLILLL